MEAKYCKCKNTYTRECDCEESVWSQGVGSLTGQGNSNVTQVKNERTI